MSLVLSTKGINHRSIKGHLGTEGSKNEVKLQTTSNDKSNGVNVLVLGKHTKVSTVTYSSDLRLRVKGQRKVKLQNVSNDKSNSVNVLGLGKHA